MPQSTAHRYTFERPARLRYWSNAIVADDLEMRVGDTTLVAKGRLGPGTAEVRGCASG